ncbi:hypothetical protein GCM10025864_16420 [Luteimicrobium album]|uniref:Uncharacterized protein n=1 Tax=Luteimicrobium album TaxID=1054550 RepID=A0ABQ6I142_9MICO|nr:hypothetical protein [Luteimicrobium album]GMA23883.1 hypothetical protein GCM10025864_16420 [Luteimicrobium album]
MLPWTAVVAGSGIRESAVPSSSVPAGLVGFACGTSPVVDGSASAATPAGSSGPAGASAAVSVGVDPGVGSAPVGAAPSAARTPVVAPSLGRVGDAVLVGDDVLEGAGLSVDVGAVASVVGVASWSALAVVFPTALSHGDVVSGSGGSSALTGRSTGA